MEKEQEMVLCRKIVGELNRKQQIRAADQLQGRICSTSAPLGGCSLAQSSAVGAHTNITGVQSQALLQQQHHCRSLSRKKPTPIQYSHQNFRHPPGHCSLLASCASWERTGYPTPLFGTVRCAHITQVGAKQTNWGCQGRCGPPQEATCPWGSEVPSDSRRSSP